MSGENILFVVCLPIIGSMCLNKFYLILIDFGIICTYYKEFR